MAWLSVGSSNEDLCQKLVMNDVLKEGPLLEAFRATDRGDFVADEDRLQAYADRPFKKGKIHISAPHMYVTVLEALDLKTGKSFLNIGSGSGYLSCLAAFLLGEEGISHGVEVSETTCNFSRERAKLWHAKMLAKGVQKSSLISADGLSFVHANCFDLDVLSAASTLRYDRIYVGAGCPDARKEFFLSMLADNGVLVAPINEKNQMLSIRKFCGRVYCIKPISSVNFAPLIDTEVRPDEEDLLGELAAQESHSLRGDLEASILKVQAAPSSNSFIIHPVAAPVALSPSTSSSSSSAPSAAAHISSSSHTAGLVKRVRLPPLVWAPQRKRHLQFPPEFRRAVVTVLLANNRCVPRPCGSAGRSLCPPHCRCSRGGASLFLPHQMWLLVFSFANREWFHPAKSELHAVSMELAVERRLRRATEEKLRRAEDARRTAERERDLLRIAMLRLSKRHRVGQHAAAGQGGGGGAFSTYMGLLSEGEDAEDSDYADEDDEEVDEEEEGSEEEEEDLEEEEDEQAGEGEEGVESEGMEQEEGGADEGEEDLLPSHLAVYGPSTLIAPPEEVMQMQMESTPMSFATVEETQSAGDGDGNGEGEGVWADVEGDGEGAYWYAYNNYLETMQPAAPAQLGACAVSSYQSTSTATTAETTGTLPSAADALGGAGVAGERISDFSVEGDGPMAWEEGDDPSFFQADDA